MKKVLSFTLALLMCVAFLASSPLNALALSENARYYNSLPKTIYAIKGETISIYFDDILSLPNMKIAFTVPVGLTRKLYDDRIEIKAESSGDFEISWRVYDYEYVLCDQGTLTVRVRKNKLKNMSVLVIGDSTVDQNVMTESMYQIFQENGKTLTLLGTRGNSEYNRHEGRGGWTYAYYCTKAKVGTKANAFYNDGFDFSYYMENQGYQKPKAVFIQLGINDIKNYTLENYNGAKVLSYTQKMFDSIRQYSSTLPIVFVLPPLPNANDEIYSNASIKNPFEYRNNIIHFSRELMNVYEDLPNVYISAANCVINGETDLKDRLHPTDEGYEKMAVRNAAFLNYLVNKEVTPEPASITRISATSDGVELKWTTLQDVLVYAVFREDKGYLGETTSTSFVDETVVSGKTYKYFVRTHFNSGYVYDSDTKTITVLSTPKIKTVKNSAKGISVSWGKVKGAEKYKLYRKSKGDTNWKGIKNLTGTSFVDTTAKSGVTYTYTVRAVKGETVSAYNKTGTSINFIATPKISSAQNSNGSVSVSWKKIKGAKGYYVYRKTSENGSWSKIANTTKTKYTDKNVKSGKNYIYTVKAYNGKTTSSFISSGTTVKYLSTPKLSKAVSKKAGVTVSYGKVTGAAGYIIYRKQGNSGWKQIGTASGNKTLSYVDKTARKGVTYTYTVKAVNGKAKSSYNSKGLSVKDKY